MWAFFMPKINGFEIKCAQAALRLLPSTSSGQAQPRAPGDRVSLITEGKTGAVAPMFLGCGREAQSILLLGVAGFDSGDAHPW